MAGLVFRPGGQPVVNPLITTFRHACRQFADARGGNVAVTFAIACIPLIGLTGAAVDYSRASKLRTAMQAAADATALMVAQTAAKSSSAAVQSSTEDFFRGILNNPAAQNLKVTGTYGGSTVLVQATATYKTSFTRVLGVKTLSLAATSAASFGNPRRGRARLVMPEGGQERWEVHDDDD